jgi:hypothetical protein
MSLTQSVSNDLLYQLGGITGLGWTASLLAYIWATIGPADGLGGPIAIDPRILLVLGVVFFVVTVGLDRLQTSVADR